MKHFITLKEYSGDELKSIIEKAIEIKANPEKYYDVLKNKTLIMLFQKTSTRTRLSFEAGMTQLGGHAIFLEQRSTQMTFADFSDEMSAVMRYGDVLMFRARKAADVLKAASLNKIPVIDACSEKYHPAQAMGDLLTMAEKAGGIGNVKKVVFLGVESNVSNSLKLVCAKLGIKIVLASPEADPSGVDEELNAMANESGIVEYTTDIKQALEGADFVYTDAWMNMEYFADNGEPKPEFKDVYEKRKALLQPYQLNADLVNNNCPDAKIMHCMPCHLGYEITADAVHHPNSVIFDQAENRMHAQKAVMLKLLGL